MLFQIGYPLKNSIIFEAAAEQGSLQVLKWLKANGCNIDDPSIFQAAAFHGSLENLKWLKANGCNIDDPYIFRVATEQGSLENLKWLKANGCPIDHTQVLKTAFDRNIPMENRIWLLENSCRSETDAQLIYERARLARNY